MTPTIVASAIPEIKPGLKLSKADLVILRAARGICEQARKLTTESIDDDSVWADAQLSLDTAIQSYEATK